MAALNLDEALQRLRGVEVQPGRWLRGYGWRSGDWQPQRDPTRHELDAITGRTPAGLIAKDYHSLWLDSAALELANGDLEVDGGVVERDEKGEPTGILREEAAWRFKERHMIVPDADYLDAMRAGCGSRTRAASQPSTTRTAGSGRCDCGSSSTSAAS